MTKIKAAAKRPGNSKQTILHIYHFGSRYEFDPYGHIDRFKVGPLKYVKKFIGSGEDDETVSYADIYNPTTLRLQAIAGIVTDGGVANRKRAELVDIPIVQIKTNTPALFNRRKISG